MSKIVTHSRQLSSHDIRRNYSYANVLQSNTDSVRVVNWTDTVTYGDNVPNWRKNVKLGTDATTSLDVDGKVLTVKRGRLVAENSTPTGAPTDLKRSEMIGDFGLSLTNNSDPSGLSSVKANARALSSFVKKAMAVNTTFQGGIFLGELAEAIHGIRHPAQGLRELVDAYRHKAVKLRSVEGFRIKRIPFEKHLADLWLEQAFHWRPLISDIQDAAKAAAQIVNKEANRPTTKRITAVGTERTSISYSQTGHLSGFLSWRENNSAYNEVVVVYRGAIRIKGVDSIDDKLSLLGFNVENFLPTAWELLPYSFLIDYFTNVGEMVTAIGLPRSNVVWSNQTIIRQIVADRQCEALYPSDVGPAIKLVSFDAPRVVSTKRLISRRSYSGTFIPDLYFETPGSGSLKWLNIAALGIAQLEDRRFRWL
jgi:hypothetical protein